jgi:hypothetical protein
MFAEYAIRLCRQDEVHLMVMYIHYQDHYLPLADIICKLVLIASLAASHYKLNSAIQRQLRTMDRSGIGLRWASDPPCICHLALMILHKIALRLKREECPSNVELAAAYAMRIRKQLL